MTKATVCSRCGQQAKVHIPDTPRCEACFTHYLQRTFKTAIGRLNAGGRRTVAVGVSGGESSTAAALLLRDYHLTLTVNPKLAPARIILVHVRTHSDYSGNATEQETGQMGIHDTSVIDALHAAIPTSDLVVVGMDPVDFELLCRVRDHTDRTQLKRAALFKTLARTAAQHECDTVILGSSVSRMACDVLCAIATARGSQVFDDACGALSRHPQRKEEEEEEAAANVRFVRPLGSVPIRLLVRYARMWLLASSLRWQSLSMQTQDTNPVVNFVHDRVPQRSIQSVAQQFICSVADDNVSSVHNVVRVSERLLAPSGPTCVLCHHVIINIDDDDGLYHQRQPQKEAIQQPASCNSTTATGCVTCHNESNGDAGDSHVMLNGNGVHGCRSGETEAMGEPRATEGREVCIGCAWCVERAGGWHNEDNVVAKLVRREAMRSEIEDFLL